MRLILSGRHPRNSTYSTETGQVLYKVHKPFTTFAPGTATIRKAVDTVNGVWQGNIKPSEQRSVSPLSEEESTGKLGDRDARSHPSVDSDVAFADSESDDEAEPGSSGSEPAFEGHFAFYAQVEFHHWKASRFQYNDLDISVDDFFRKEGYSVYGRGRVFKASDGNEYRWELRAFNVAMVRNDKSKKRVVEYRRWRPNLGPIMKARPASLEIDPSCVPILDEIMMTFIYCHKLRKFREKMAEKRPI